jgi:hypothetical protein
VTIWNGKSFTWRGILAVWWRPEPI